MNTEATRPAPGTSPSPWARPVVRALAALAGALGVLDAALLMARGLLHLGVVLPLGIGAVLLALAAAGPRWGAWLAARPRWRRLWRLGCAGFGLWLLSLLVFFVHIQRQADAARSPDRLSAAPRAIVVLGSGTPDCKPSATLQARLDLARAWAQRWPDAAVLSSGGADWGHTCTEGRVMADALRAAGLPGARLLTEERSTSTEENLRFSQAVLAAHGIDAGAPLLIVTSDFHAPRAAAIARRTGYRQAQAIGAPTPLLTRYNAWLREYFALLSGWALREF